MREKERCSSVHIVRHLHCVGIVKAPTTIHLNTFLSNQVLLYEVSVGGGGGEISGLNNRMGSHTQTFAGKCQLGCSTKRKTRSVC